MSELKILTDIEVFTHHCIWVEQALISSRCVNLFAIVMRFEHDDNNTLFYTNFVPVFKNHIKFSIIANQQNVQNTPNN